MKHVVRASFRVMLFDDYGMIEGISTPFVADNKVLSTYNNIMLFRYLLVAQLDKDCK